MTDTHHPWSENWADRIAQRLNETGYNCLSDLLAEMPSRSYADVAQKLDESIAPIQLLSVQYKEAKASGQMRTAAMDSLCRNIVEGCPDGWGKGEDPDWQIIKALSGWSSEIIATGESPELEPMLDCVMNELRTSPPSTGWLPSGPDDPIITKAFDNGWPT